jgi:hypothetical protein
VYLLHAPIRVTFGYASPLVLVVAIPPPPVLQLNCVVLLSIGYRSVLCPGIFTVGRRERMLCRVLCAVQVLLLSIALPSPKVDSAEVAWLCCIFQIGFMHAFVLNLGCIDPSGQQRWTSYDTRARFSGSCLGTRCSV